MNEEYTENKECARLLCNLAHSLFSDFFHRQCVSNDYKNNNATFATR